MTEANKAYLEKYMMEWHLLKQTGQVKHLDFSVRKELARIYHEELDPKAILDITCPTCVVEWFKVLYLNYEKQHGEWTSLLPVVHTVNPNAQKPEPRIIEKVKELVPDVAGKARKGKGGRP
jgi:hypothetical protein